MLTDKMEINATSALDNMYILWRSNHVGQKQHLWQWINEKDSDTQKCSYQMDTRWVLNIKWTDCV